MFTESRQGQTTAPWVIVPSAPVPATSRHLRTTTPPKCPSDFRSVVETTSQDPTLLVWSVGSQSWN